MNKSFGVSLMSPNRHRSKTETLKCSNKGEDLGVTECSFSFFPPSFDLKGRDVSIRAPTAPYSFNNPFETTGWLIKANCVAATLYLNQGLSLR